MRNRFYFILILLNFISIQNIFAQTFKIEELEFNTPEAAIEHFISSIIENNIYNALRACAINEYCENFDYIKYTEYLQAMILYNSPAPSNGDMLTEINKIERMYNLSLHVKYFCYCLLTEEKLDGLTISNPSYERLSAFINSLDTSRLKNLEIISIRAPYPNLIKSERYIRYSTMFAGCFGADEKTERLVLYNFENRLYLGGFQLFRYGNSWKIESLYSSLAGTSCVEVLTETSMNEFESLTSDY